MIVFKEGISVSIPPAGLNPSFMPQLSQALSSLVGEIAGPCEIAATACSILTVPTARAKWQQGPTPVACCLRLFVVQSARSLPAGTWSSAGMGSLLVKSRRPLQAACNPKP